MRTILAVLLLAAMPLASGLSLDETPTATPTSMGQAIIGFHPGFLPATEVGAFIGGVQVLNVEDRIDYLVVAADTLEQAREAVANVPGISYIEDDFIMTSLVVPNDSRYSDQYGPAQMGAHAAWDKVGYGSSDIVVAVLDTGIRASHEDLAANYIGGYDYVNNDNNPDDDCGHGTHVSGTVAAVTDNGKGVAGVSQASIVHHKVLGPVGGWITVTCSGSSSDINAAIMDAADDNAHIISMSLGGGGFSSSGNNAVNYAYNKGSLVVAAAGNDGQCNDCVGYPAAYANSIAVASLTSSGAQSSFSSSGPEVEIAAGGSSVWSTYNGDNSDYRSLSGTSMATPHVSGALALALSCDPSLTNVELRTLMQNTAQDLGPNGRDDDFGFGLLRIDNIVNQLSCGGGGPSNGAPSASFTASDSDLTVTVDGSGSSDPDGDSLSYSWNFGDGSSGSGASASHTYAADGTYTVTLTVNDGNGGSDSASQSVIVSGPGNPPPSGCGAGFGDAELNDGEATDVAVSGDVWLQICVPSDATSIDVTMTGPGCTLTCSFDVDLHTKVGARASTGNYDCRPYQSGNSESCSHSASGQYVSILLDAYAGSGTVTITADHNGATAPPANQDPTASFSSSCSDLDCGFNGGASSDPDGDSLSYSWNFGDGSSGSGASPSHSYASAGTYTVTLTVDDGNGGSDSASSSVTVTAPPVNQDPSASFSSSCSDLACSFNSGASSDPDGDSLSYSWNFGDGASGSGASPSHSYASAGTYTVTLTVDDGNGGSDSSSSTVSVTAPPPPPSGCTDNGDGVTIMTSGAGYTASVSSGGWAYGKICVQDGTVSVDMSNDDSCGFLGCSFDADLYVNAGSAPTSDEYDCRPYQGGSNESCSLSNVPDGWVYVGVYAYSGSGSVDLVATA